MSPKLLRNEILPSDQVSALALPGFNLRKTFPLKEMGSATLHTSWTMECPFS